MKRLAFDSEAEPWYEWITETFNGGGGGSKKFPYKSS